MGLTMSTIPIISCIAILGCFIKLAASVFKKTQLGWIQSFIFAGIWMLTVILIKFISFAYELGIVPVISVFTNALLIIACGTLFFKGRAKSIEGVPFGFEDGAKYSTFMIGLGLIIGLILSIVLANFRPYTVLTVGNFNVTLDPGLFPKNTANTLSKESPMLRAIPLVVCAIGVIFGMTLLTLEVIRQRASRTALSTEKKLTRGVFCILLIGGAVFASQPIVHALYWCLEERAWPSVTGTVEDYDGFSYAVNGTQFYNDLGTRGGKTSYRLPPARSRLYNFYPERVPGFKLPVYYDPNNPQMSVLDKRRLTIEDYIALGFALVLWYLGVLAMLLTIHSKKGCAK